MKRKLGGGPITKKIMPPGKTQYVLCRFFSFSKHVQNRRFCAEFGQKCVLKNEKDHDFCPFRSFLFFFLFFLLFLPDLVKKMSSKKEQKEQKILCRRENHKMSFVFFVVGPPPIVILAYSSQTLGQYFQLIWSFRRLAKMQKKRLVRIHLSPSLRLKQFQYRYLYLHSSHRRAHTSAINVEDKRQLLQQYWQPCLTWPWSAVLTLVKS